MAVPHPLYAAHLRPPPGWPRVQPPV